MQASSNAAASLASSGPGAPAPIGRPSRERTPTSPAPLPVRKHSSAAKTDLQRAVIARAIRAEDGVRVATAEDLIVLKLIANRPKDQVDLQGLVALPSLDWGYIERWAAEWEVFELLHRLRGR